MKSIKSFTFKLLKLINISILLLSCVSDPGVKKGRKLVKDFSISSNINGCEKNFLILSEPDSCINLCDTGTHLGTAAEITKAKISADADLLEKIDNSAGVCIDDTIVVTRPTNQIDIKSDFCSCIDGKSDLISDCTATCALRPNTSAPTLYLNTIIGPEIALNTKLGNLYNWCNVQLENEPTPQCFLSVSDGTNTIDNIPVTIAPGSNSLSANILSLALDKTYIVKIVESKSGSNAQSKEFQLRRKTQTTEDPSAVGALKVTPISQYTCMTYGGSVNTVTGQLTRTTYSRVFYYYSANETPPPIPPAGGTNQSTTVCHDEQLHPGNDNAEYSRLELIPQLFAMWDKSDPRFVNLDGTGLVINKTLTTRLKNEYGVTATIGIFSVINFPNRPVSGTTSSSSIPLGIMMTAFTDSAGKTFCPTQTDFNSSDQPLYNLLKEYMDDTEGLYLGEKEAEAVLDGGAYKSVYGTMFVTESILKTYGFYIENGLKIKANQTAMNTRTIYYYWPTNLTMDPLIQGNRKLYTVRTPATLNGNSPSGQPTTTTTTDKRIGCVPKSVSSLDQL